MKNYGVYGIALLGVYALSCGGAEVKRNNESEQKKPGYVVQPKVVPAPKCWREGMNGEETLEYMMSEESTQDF